jgi:hypothetical protein
MTAKTTPKPDTKAEPKTKTAKVGQVINLDAAFTLRLPDGTVVTGRGSYTPRVAGTYVATVDGHEHKIEVS